MKKLTPQIICDPVCEKGLSNCMYLTICNLTCEYVITLIFSLLILYGWMQYEVDWLKARWVMMNQTLQFRKAIRPLFADRVTFELPLPWQTLNFYLTRKTSLPKIYRSSTIQHSNGSYHHLSHCIIPVHPVTLLL